LINHKNTEISFVVGDQFAPSSAQRLDQFLSLHLPEFSRSRIQKLIAEGLVQVDRRPGKAGQKLKTHQTVLVAVPEERPAGVHPEEIPLTIVFEDEHLAVIDKPAGMVTHPGAGVDSGTLVHALLFHMRGSLSGIGGVLRPGIVHRLDKDTSGLLVVAKNDRAHRGLARQIQAKQARRSYLAVVEGVPEPRAGTISKPVGRDPRNRVRMAVVSTGRSAESHYRVLKASDRFALVQVELKTGRTHQIRVHMMSINCPVVGDLVYNRKSTGKEAARAKFGLAGHALHASKLVFNHPVDGRLLEFNSQLPTDLDSLVKRLF
jgi:23S rRNA pseudouridine1911/1915/1917 synthase